MVANTQFTMSTRADKLPTDSQTTTRVYTDSGIFLKGTLAVHSLDSLDDLNDLYFIFIALTLWFLTKLHMNTHAIMEETMKV